MSKNAINLTRVAPHLWVGVAADHKWFFKLGGLMYREDEISYGTQYSLDYAALALKSVEGFKIALASWCECFYWAFEKIDEHAVRALIERANKLWTFKVGR